MSCFSLWASNMAFIGSAYGHESVSFRSIFSFFALAKAVVFHNRKRTMTKYRSTSTQKAMLPPSEASR